MPSGNPGWDRQTVPTQGKPYGWIQWKGTQVCIDLHCVCGKSFHMDDEFLYYVECPHCKKSFMLNGHIELVELTKEEAEQLEEEGSLKHHGGY